jgi:hypothetical protein
MPPVPITIQPRPAEDTPVEFIADLDSYVEHSMCSCNAGDNNPY